VRGFDLAFQWILGAEGVFSDDPDDAGGQTKYGISKRAYPHLDIPALTKEQAETIYAADYWHRCQCDAFPRQVGVALFDAAVNQGPKTAVQLLQRALGVDPDGIVGPDTLAAARRKIPGDILLDFLSHRAVRYAEGEPKFRRGWFRRLFRLQRVLWSIV
jgi:lysozyme family protein